MIELLAKRKVFWVWKDQGDAAPTSDLGHEIEIGHDFEAGQDFKALIARPPYFHLDSQDWEGLQITVSLVGTDVGLVARDTWGAVVAHEMAHAFMPRDPSFARLLIELLVEVEIASRIRATRLPRLQSPPRPVDLSNPHTEAILRLPHSTLPRAAIRCPSKVPTFEVQPDPREALAA